MKIGDIGEFGLIARLKEKCLINPAGMVTGIGDDAAVLPVRAGRHILITTDMLVEKVHFDWAFSTPSDLGYKAMAANLSDIAAMGGEAENAVVAIALPPATMVETVEEIYQGMIDCAGHFGVNIAGGDTVSSPAGLVLAVTVTGSVEPANCCRRSGALPGDLLAVTGWLGGAAAGLYVLQTPDLTTAEQDNLVVSCHRRPEPRLREGRFLALTGAVTAMNDISDGLASEVNEIAAASQAGSLIQAAKIPVHPVTRAVAGRAGIDPLEWALRGGEDYELVLCLRPEAAPDIIRRFEENFHLPLTIIGVINSAQNGVQLESAGQTQPLVAGGYRHF